MTDKQAEWRVALAPSYLVVGTLALVLGLLRFDDQLTFWKLMYASVMCSFVATSISSDIYKHLSRKAQETADKAQETADVAAAGWARANEGWQRANQLLKRQDGLIKAMQEHIEVLEDVERTGS